PGQELREPGGRGSLGGSAAYVCHEVRAGMARSIGEPLSGQGPGTPVPVDAGCSAGSRDAPARRCRAILKGERWAVGGGGDMSVCGRIRMASMDAPASLE